MRDERAHRAERERLRERVRHERAHRAERERVVEHHLGERRRGCAQWSSLVTTSGTQLKSRREEEELDVVTDGPFHTVTWAGASQYQAFGRTQGRGAPFR